MDEKQKRTDRALGQDPFEGMEGMVWDETEVEAGLEAEPMEPSPPAPPGPSVIEAVVVTEEAKPEAMPKEGSIALPDEEPSPAISVEAEAEGEGEGEAVTEPDAGDSLLLEEPSDADDQETAGQGEGEAVAKPEVEDFDLLEELIATIDGEVKEAFGPGAMTSLAPESPGGASNLEQHVIFGLAGTDYAVPIANVTEIGRPLDVTPVPNVPDWVLGVANLRGDIVSAVDMRAFLGMEPTGFSQASRMMVAQGRQEDMTTCLLVDRVSGIRYLAVHQIGAPTAPIEDQVAPYLRGVYEDDGHLLVVLDFDHLLLSPEMQQFQPL